MFGSQLPVSLGGQSPLDTLPVSPPDMPGMIIPQKAGMFGGKFGIGQAIVAALNGYLAGSPGPGQQVGLQNIQMMAAQRQRQMERQQELDDYNRHRGDTNADWKSHFDYTQANNPDDMSSHMIAAGIDPHSPQGKALYAASLDPVVMTPQGPMTRSQLLGANAGQPAPQGVTFTPLPDQGGPTPGGSGGFPGY